jgi:uncharacterized protein YaaW (UPF0174 family)
VTEDNGLDELRAALDLATDEELGQLTHILFCRRFNPLDYFQTPAVAEVQQCDRTTQLALLQQRFFFLAADGMTVLRGRSHAISYHQVLIQVCRYLKIPHTASLSVLDLEAEIFLHLMGQAWQKLPTAEQNSLTVKIQRSLTRTDFAEPLPAQLQHNPMQFLLKGGGVVAISAVVRSLVLNHIARQFTLHFAQYQATQAILRRGGAIAAGQLQHQIALQAARRGMVTTAARHGAARTLFAALGPILWATFLADLGWRAIATNYGRIIPIIFAIAQIRLTRAAIWEPVLS